MVDKIPSVSSCQICDNDFFFDDGKPSQSCNPNGDLSSSQDDCRRAQGQGDGSKGLCWLKMNASNNKNASHAKVVVELHRVLLFLFGEYKLKNG